MTPKGVAMWTARHGVPLGPEGVAEVTDEGYRDTALVVTRIDRKPPSRR